MSKPLNVRQERFAELFVGGMPGGRAYEAAGYTARGHAADVNAERLLRNADVQAKIAELRAKLSEKLEFKREDLVRHLVAAITTPVGKIDENSPLAQEVGYDREGRKRIKAVGKNDSARLLCDILGWKEPEQLVVETGPKTLEAIEKRAAAVVSFLDRTKA